MPLRALNVAEKPSAAKEISNILSRGSASSRPGRSQYNRIFEFQFDFRNENATGVQMAMTSLSGHLMNMDFAGHYREWGACSPEELFSAPVHKIVSEHGSGDAIQRTLEEEARKADWLILWLDSDREGENISFEVIQVCIRVKPTLRILRARFSSFTPRDILRAVNNLGDPNRNESEAVDLRQEVDLRIGAAFTRWLTQRIRVRFPSLHPAASGAGSNHNNGNSNSNGAAKKFVVSYGPCQFPTLGFVVERQCRIEAFVAEKFFSLEMSHRVQDSSNSTSTSTSSMTTINFHWDRHRLFDRHVCFALYELCLRAGEVCVESIVKRVTRKWRPVPLNTVQLQKLAAIHLRMASEKTMHIAESLYQAGWISYPRTETDIFTLQTVSDDDLKQLVQEQTKSPIWGAYATQLGAKFVRPRAGKNNDKAHPPIHPTQVPLGEKWATSLDSDAKKLYELIARHFLACCSADAVGSETVVRVRFEGTAECFSARGLIIEEMNYLEVYGPYERWSTANQIPSNLFREGQRFSPSLLRMAEGSTAPPRLLSEADLITTMDANGIGTDATIATHIKTIQDREYVVKETAGSSTAEFRATQLGRALVEGFKLMDLTPLWKPSLRAKVESDMRRVAMGHLDKRVALTQMIQMYKEAFLVAATRGHLLDQAIAQWTRQQPVSAAPVGSAAGMAGEDPSVPTGFLLFARCGGSCKTGAVLCRTTSKQRKILACCSTRQCSRQPIWCVGSILSVRPVLPEELCPRCGWKKIYGVVARSISAGNAHLRRHPADGAGNQEKFCMQCDQNRIRDLYGD